jgi:hypothetical protein
MIKKNRGVITFWLAATLAVIFITMLSSCASRKVITDKLVIKLDSVSVIKDTLSIKVVDSSYVKKEAILEDIIIRPIDSCAEFIVDGKVYKNVTITIKKQTNSNVHSKSKKTDLNTSKTQKTAVKTETIVKKKEIVKKANYIMHLAALLFVILVGFIVYKYHNKINVLRVFS